MSSSAPFTATPHENQKATVLVVVVVNVSYPALLYIIQTSEHRRPTTEKDVEILTVKP